MKYQHTTVTVPDYAITYDDDFIGVVYTKIGKTTLTLPEIDIVGEIMYTIVDESLNAGVNNITVKVANNSSYTIHGSQSQVIQNDGGNMKIYNNGTDCWFIIY